MFGFCCPPVQDLEYRSLYSRCCQHQRLHYGPLSLAFTSYESVLLFACAVDAHPEIKTAIPSQTCCRFRRLGDMGKPASDAGIGQFVSSLAMILAETKLADDIRDRNSIRARIVKRLLGTKIRNAYEYFESVDVNFSQMLDGAIERHLALEGGSGGISLVEYGAETSKSFGYVFGLMARLPGMNAHFDFLTRLGQYIGRAIISFDCGHDWYEDRESGQPNPLRSEADILTATTLARTSIQKAADLCESHLGIAAASTRILRSIYEALEPDVVRAPTCVLNPDTLEMLGLAPSKKYFYTRSLCSCDDWRGCACACLCCCAVIGGSSEKVVHVYHHRGC